MPDIIKDVKRVDRLNYTGSFKKTDEGSYVVDAPVARTGIYEYLLPDGTIQRDLVLSKYLFDKESMETLKLKPVTNSHPQETFVNIVTNKDRRVGQVGETVEPQGNKLFTRMVIDTQEGIDAIESGKRQLSPGYLCDYIDQPGVYQGQPYDVIQINRRYNHVAIVDNARGGSELAIKIDGADDYGVMKDLIKIDENDVEDAPLSTEQRNALPDSSFALVKTENGSKIRKFPYLTANGAPDKPRIRNALARLSQSNLTSKEKQMVFNKVAKAAKKAGIEVQEQKFDSFDIDVKSNKNNGGNMPTIRLDGHDYEASSEVITYIGELRQQKKDADVKVDGFEKDATELKTKLDEKTKEVSTLEAKCDDLKAKLDSFEERNLDAEIKAGIKERLEVEKIANEVLADDVKIDSMDNAEIKKAVVTAKYPDVKLDEKDETYINVRFDIIAEDLAKAGEKKIDEQNVKSATVFNKENIKVDEAEKNYLNHDWLAKGVK